MEATQTYDELRTRTEKLADALLKRRIQRGLDLLRQQYGDDWVDHIDLSELDMRNTNCCILGQLERDSHGGDFNTAIERIDGDLEEAPHSFGFDSEDGFGYHALQDAWLTVLTGEQA